MADLHAIDYSELTVLDAEHPWPGLASFTEMDAHYFKGRQQQIEDLFALVNRERLTVLFGISGLGKTSLLTAGLFPLARINHGLPVMIRLDFSMGTQLQQQVFDAIVSCLRASKIEGPTPDYNRSLWEYFHHKKTQFWDTRNRLITPILCFDQFEELFTLGRDHSQSHAIDQFVTELADLIEGSCPALVRARIDSNPDEAKEYSFSKHSYKVMLSLREDYLASLETIRDRMPSVIHNRMRLLPMNGQQALEVATITEGKLMEHGAAEAVVRLVAGHHSEANLADLQQLQVEPALLSLFCHELNALRIKNGERQINTHAVKANKEHILEDFYRRCLHDQATALREFIEDKLVTVSGHRNSEALDNAIQTPGVTRQALDKLIQRRLLLQRNDERNGQIRIELIHDVLTEVVCKSRAQRAMRLKQMEIEQQRAAAEENANRARLELQARKRHFMVLSALLSLALMAVSWAWWNAWKAEQLSKQVESRRLGMVATLLADTASEERVIERAAALAIESWKTQHNTDANAAASKLQRMLPVDIVSYRSPIYALAVSLDGKMVATGERDHHLQILSSSDRKSLLKFDYDDSINRLAFSPDGQWIAVGCQDGVVSVLDIGSQQEVFRMRQSAPITSLRITDDGRLLAAADMNGQIDLIDLMKRKPLSRIQQKTEIKSIYFSSQHDRLATASQDGIVRIFNYRSGKLDNMLPLGLPVTQVSFSRNGEFLAAVSGDTAYLFSSSNYIEVRRVQHRAKIGNIAFSPDSKLLATASDDQTARVTNIANGSVVGQWLFKHAAYSARFSTDGRLLAISSLDQTIRLIDTIKWREISRLVHGGAVWNIDFCTIDQQLVSISQDQKLRFFQTIQQPDDVSFDSSGVISSLAIHPNGIDLAAADTVFYPDRSFNSARAVVYNLTAGSKRTQMGYNDQLYGVSYSPDGRYLVMYGKKGAVLTESHSNALIAHLLPAQEIRTIAFSADSRWLAIGSSSGLVNVVTTWNGKEIAARQGNTDIRAMAFNANSNRLALASLDGMQLLDTETWSLDVKHSSVVAASQLAFSPAGAFLAVGSDDGVLRLMDTENFSEISKYPHPATITHIKFSANGNWLASATMDSTASVFKLKSGTLELTASIKHGGLVTALNFSPNSRWLATASEDGTSRLLETSTGLEVQRRQHEDAVLAIAFSPNSDYLVVGGVNGMLKIQNSDPQKRFDQLCMLHGRNLDKSEAYDYLGLAKPHKTCEGWLTPGNEMPGNQKPGWH